MYYLIYAKCGNLVLYTGYYYSLKVLMYLVLYHRILLYYLNDLNQINKKPKGSKLA